MKLTPAAFVLFFLLRRDYRAAAVAAVSFAAATAAGFALAGHDSVRYWTAAVFQTGRIGGPATAANQCIQAVLARAGLDPHTLRGSGRLAGAIGPRRDRGVPRHAARARGVAGLPGRCRSTPSPSCSSRRCPGRTTGCGARRACSPSPTSAAASPSRLAVAAAACGLVLFAAAPQWWLGRFAGPELRWAVWQQVIGSSYVFFAALVLLLSACGQLTPRAPGSPCWPRSRSLTS